MSQHTEGPWIENPEFPGSINSGKKHIAMINRFRWGGDSDVFGEEYEANLRLICAAPELLEALQDAVSDILNMPHSHALEQLLVTLDAAIAKAVQP